MKSVINCLLFLESSVPTIGDNKTSYSFFVNESQNIINLISIVSSLLSIGMVIYGFTYLSRFKDKKDSASFTYWTQFRIYLVMMEKYLEKYPQLCDNIWNEESRIEASREGAVVKQVLQDYQNLCSSFLTFAKEASDQIPAYKGWTNDYVGAISCATDMIVYDITDSAHKFKHQYNNGEEIIVELKDMEDYHKRFCSYLRRLDNGIAKCQIDIEERICKDYYTIISSE